MSVFKPKIVFLQQVFYEISVVGTQKSEGNKTRGSSSSSYGGAYTKRHALTRAHTSVCSLGAEPM